MFRSRTSPKFVARARVPALASLIVLGLAALSGCSSLEFRRSTQTSGTFTSRGWAFTIISVDIPKTAEQIARENASDSNQPNLQITDVFVAPYLGPLDWLLDIIGVRYCRLDGTWGYGDPTTAPGGTKQPGS